MKRAYALNATSYQWTSMLVQAPKTDVQTVAMKQGHSPAVDNYRKEYTMETKLPERINVMKVMTYDVQQIVNDLIESGQEDGTVTLDDVMEYVEVIARDDFSFDPMGDLIFQTDDGEDL